MTPTGSSQSARWTRARGSRRQSQWPTTRCVCVCVCGGGVSRPPPHPYLLADVVELSNGRKHFAAWTREYACPHPHNTSPDVNRSGSVRRTLSAWWLRPSSTQSRTGRRGRGSKQRTAWSPTRTRYGAQNAVRYCLLAVAVDLCVRGHERREKRGKASKRWSHHRPAQEERAPRMLAYVWKPLTLTRHPKTPPNFPSKLRPRIFTHTHRQGGCWRRTTSSRR